MEINFYTPNIYEPDDGGDFLRDEYEDWVRSGRKEEVEREALGFYDEEEKQHGGSDEG